MAWVTKDSVEPYDHTPEPPKEYTKEEKAQNWWHYHKFIVLGVVVAILVVAWFIKDTVFQTRPDVQIGYIGQYDLPVDTVTALQDALTPYCTDLNGDGKVVVQVNSYTIDFNAENDNTDAYNQMAGVTRLSADLSDSGTLSEESAILGFSGVLLRTSTERPEVVDKGTIVIGGIACNDIEQAIDLVVSMRANKEKTVIAQDYCDENVSVKVAKIIQSYTKIINKFVWRK